MNTVSEIIQKIILLGTGAPKDNSTRDEITQLFEQADDWSQVNAFVDAFMTQQALEDDKGVNGVVQSIANNGFGLKLTDQKTEQLVTSLITQGVDSWSKLFAFVITEIDGELGARLDNRAEAADRFADLLTELNKESDYNGTQAVNVAREWIAGIGASTESLAVANDAVRELVNSLINGNVQGKVFNGLIAGATVFIDENSDGTQNSGEISTTTDELGNFQFTGDVPQGVLTSIGGTDIATDQPVIHTLSAPSDAVIISPLTTLVQQLLNSGHAENIVAAEDIVFQTLELHRVDLSSFNPITISLNQNSSVAEQYIAIQLQATTAQVTNLLNVSTALLNNNAVIENNTAQAITDSLLAALVTAEQNNQTVDLANIQTINNIIASVTTVDSNSGNIDNDVTQVATLLSEINTIVQLAADNVNASPQTALSDIFKLQILTQTHVVPAIDESTLGTNDLAGVVVQFTGNNLLRNVDKIKVGTLDGNTPANDGSELTNLPSAPPSSDTTAPTLSGSIPADNATAVLADNNIVLTFNENVATGSGNIIISNGSDTRTISVSDATQITLSDNTVTINPTNDLAAGSTYNVQLASGVITDIAGNAFAGITDATTLNFSVGIIALSAVEQNDNNSGFVINGVSAGDQSGFSVSSAGDVNGDGLADLIVGALFDDPNGNSDSGASFVVFGKTDGTAVELSSIENGLGGFVINGVGGRDQSGISVSSAGDVNGDGLADLIVGANRDDPNSTDSGASFVVFGKTNGTPVELSSIENGTGGFVINGTNNRDFSGFSVSGAGDVNGDGFDDLIVGAAWGNSSADNSGTSYVIFGKTDGATIELSSIESGSGGFVINGISEKDYNGYSVSSAGDVNGDGLADLIIGAPGDDPNESNGADVDGLNSSGASFVVFGKTSTTAVALSTIESGTGGFIINGVSAGDQSGRSVSSAGDVNGDGLADLIVGARRDDPNGNSDSGASFVVFGKTDGTAVELSSIENGLGGFVINGVSANDWSGRSVSSAGDINGDGLDDLIVGALLDDPNGNSNSGASFVVFGKTDGTAVELSSIENGLGGFVINGVSADDISGISVSDAGDVNGDGFADLIVGALYDDPNGDNSGANFVIFGGQSSSATIGTSGTDTLTGNSSANQLVAGAGDDLLTGNGGADVLRGGAGDDILAISDLTFASIDGGTGADTLRFDIALNQDFRALADVKLKSIEIIDLTADGGNSTLSFNITDVLNLNETQTAADTLVIHGNNGDTINLYNVSNGQTGSWADAGLGAYEFTANGGIGLIGTVTIDTDATVNII